MALKFMTAEEAAAFVHNDDNVGFSGFTPAGARKWFRALLPERQLKNTKKEIHLKSVCLQVLLQVINWMENWLVPMQLIPYSVSIE